MNAMQADIINTNKDINYFESSADKDSFEASALVTDPTVSSEELQILLNDPSDNAFVPLSSDARYNESNCEISHNDTNVTIGDSIVESASVTNIDNDNAMIIDTVDGVEISEGNLSSTSNVVDDISVSNDNNMHEESVNMSLTEHVTVTVEDSKTDGNSDQGCSVSIENNVDIM
jgi:hypothetical protein